MTICQSWNVLQKYHWLKELSSGHWQSTHQGLAGSRLGARFLASCTTWGFLRARGLKVLRALCHKSASYRKVPKPWTGANLKLSESPDLVLRSQETGQQDMPAPKPAQLLYLKQCTVWAQEPPLNSLLPELSDFTCECWKPWLSGCACSPGCTDTEIHWEFPLRYVCLFLNYV